MKTDHASAVLKFLQSHNVAEAQQERVAALFQQRCVDAASMPTVIAIRWNLNHGLSVTQIAAMLPHTAREEMHLLAFGDVLRKVRCGFLRQLFLHRSLVLRTDDSSGIKAEGVVPGA